MSSSEKHLTFSKLFKCACRSLNDYLSAARPYVSKAALLSLRSRMLADRLTKCTVVRLCVYVVGLGKGKAEGM